MAIKEHDFIELEYTGKIKDEGIVFDTSDKKTAEEAGIASQKMEYGPITVCVGEKHVLPGLDADLVGKEAGKEYNVTIVPEGGFGKKDARLIQLIATNKFTKEGIRPVPGLQINADGQMGIVKTVTGGRTLVDFNHPLAGKELEYSYKVNKVVTDLGEKAKALLKLQLGNNATTAVKDNKLTITTGMQFPQEMQDALKEAVVKVLPELKEVTFAVDESKKPAGTHTHADGTVHSDHDH